MKSVEERSKYDDYKMLDKYNFSDDVRGRFYEYKKSINTFPLLLAHNAII